MSPPSKGKFLSSEPPDIFVPGYMPGIGSLGRTYLLVLPLCTVDSCMNVELRVLHEAKTTYMTDIPLVTAVSPQMQRQCVGSAKTFLALRAPKGSGSRMRQLVILKIAEKPEFASTRRALVRPLACVPTHVFLKRFGRGKSRPTVLANKRLLAGVSPHVTH